MDNFADPLIDTELFEKKLQIEEKIPDNILEEPVSDNEDQQVQNVDQSEKYKYLYTEEVERIIAAKTKKIHFLYHVDVLSPEGIAAFADICFNVYSNTNISLDKKDLRYFKRHADKIKKIAQKTTKDRMKKQFIARCGPELLRRLCKYRPQFEGRKPSVK